MTTGLVIGKFYPPHKGHHLLIRTARAQVDRLVVMVCVHESQTIPGELRKAWLEEIHPDCEIVSVPDTLPEEPVAWAEFTLDLWPNLGDPSPPSPLSHGARGSRGPDVVFSSEDYGEPFARHMGARHVMVDRERATVPISGTAIRVNPLAHLDFLEPCVRAYFVRRVVLVGAESTGKTTLAQRLGERFDTQWVPEYGREYWARRLDPSLPLQGKACEQGELGWGDSGSLAVSPHLSPADGAGPPLQGEETLVRLANAKPWATDEFVHIAEEQQRRENEAARSANKVLICDTNAFATGIWHERYMGFRSPNVDAIGEQDVAHLYLLCVPDFPFVQDGFRDGEQIRDWMHDRFVCALQGKIVVRIGGSEEQRLGDAIEAIGALLVSSRQPTI
jgi:NadR type nicotinamide-nucleotide adenylyltransferase